MASVEKFTLSFAVFSKKPWFLIPTAIDLMCWISATKRWFTPPRRLHAYGWLRGETTYCVFLDAMCWMYYENFGSTTRNKYLLVTRRDRCTFTAVVLLYYCELRRTGVYWSTFYFSFQSSMANPSADDKPMSSVCFQRGRRQFLKVFCWIASTLYVARAIYVFRV